MTPDASRASGPDDDGTRSSSVPVPEREIAPPSVLESRYRTLLRILPRGYRSLREEEMVAAFLASMYDEDPENFDLTSKHGRPSFAEVRSIAALAVLTRWGRDVAPERFAARATAARHVLLIAIAVMWTLAALPTVGTALVWWWPAADPTGESARILFGAPRSAWRLVESWGFLGWLPSLPAAIWGNRRIRQAAAAFAGVPTAVHAYHLLAWPAGSAATMTVSLIGFALSIAAIIGLASGLLRDDSDGHDEMGSDVRDRGRREAVSNAGPDRSHCGYPYAIGAAVSLALGSTLLIILIAVPATQSSWALLLLAYILGFDTGWWALGAAALCISVVPIRRRRTETASRAAWDSETDSRRAGTALGAAFVAAIAVAYAAAGLWLVAPRAYSGLGWDQPPVVAAVIRCVVAGFALIVAAPIAVRRLRALPGPVYSTAV